jgi:protein-S-isoprenylcysteine O-methyltransferase Ste14
MSGGRRQSSSLVTLGFLIGEQPPKLVRQGLYRISRNPMYVGVLIAVFGQALIFASEAVALYGVALWLCFHAVVEQGAWSILRRIPSPSPSLAGMAWTVIARSN